jgi:hypothetical protein
MYTFLYNIIVCPGCRFVKWSFWYHRPKKPATSMARIPKLDTAVLKIHNCDPLGQKVAQSRIFVRQSYIDLHAIWNQFLQATRRTMSTDGNSWYWHVSLSCALPDWAYPLHSTWKGQWQWANSFLRQWAEWAHRIWALDSSTFYLIDVDEQSIQVPQRGCR